MNSSVLTELDWETRFENATEDISSFEWMVTGLVEEPQKDLTSFRLIELLSGRSRGRQAVREMNSGNLPASYDSYREKLQTMLEKNDVLFKEFLEKQWREIRPFFLEGGEAWRLVMDLRQVWNRLERVFREWFVFHDESDPPDEVMREQAMEFLHPFSDLFRAAYDPPEWLERQPEFQAWKQTFIQEEKGFQNGFGYLEPLADTLEAIRHREYDTEFWWLKTRPSVDSVVQPQLNEAWLAQALQPSADSPHGTLCPDSASIISYAFHELTDAEHRRIRQHVRNCGACLKLVLDLRAAAVREDQAPVASWDQYLAELPKPIKMAELLRQPFHPEVADYLFSRFRKILQWPESISDCKTFLEMFSRAVFRRDVLPLMASDITGESLLGKLITIDEKDYVQSILPTSVIVHRLYQEEQVIYVSLELAGDLEGVTGLDYYFGWEFPGGTFLDLETLELEQRNRFVVAKLEKSIPKVLEGNLHLVIIHKIFPQ